MLNSELHAQINNPEILSRIKQHEMAFRMQASVPELTDLSQETAETFALYGEQVETPGSFAACCLQARRLVERGVRISRSFIVDGTRTVVCQRSTSHSVEILTKLQQLSSKT